MNESRDDDLRGAFAALRREPSPAPAFGQLSSDATLGALRRRRRRVRGAVLAVSMIVPVLFALRWRQDRGPDFARFSELTGLDPGAATWTAPSDFLLEIPGRDLLRSIPLTDIVAPATADSTARPADSNTIRRSSDS
jgi:hypothetical protein